MAEETFDPTQDITPEQFAQLVAGAKDDEIGATIRGIGTEKVLTRVFEGMQERFVPDRAEGVDADVQFVIKDEGEEHPYGISIHDKSCTASRTKLDAPKVTLTTDLVSFVKLVTGKAQGPSLFMRGRLKVSGDLMFSQRLMTFFERPKA
ncbi:MAG TPA: SCP2 sterol-binding domain-containing protein [Actinomycetota bacterium]|nr:SCP2 sterol-binding domain-containing protein [Actinomycetota bacterium]